MITIITYLVVSIVRWDIKWIKSFPNMWMVSRLLFLCLFTLSCTSDVVMINERANPEVSAPSSFDFTPYEVHEPSGGRNLFAK